MSVVWMTLSRSLSSARRSRFRSVRRSSANRGTNTTHPVDVAVMKLPENKDWGAIAFRYCPKDCPQKEYNQLGMDDIGPPSQVVVLGFPANIGLRLKEPRPMARHGVVALKKNEEFIEVSGKYF